MNKIQEVKEKADILKIAQYFNLNLNRANKCLCPFHLEKTPSLSIVNLSAKRICSVVKILSILILAL